jgi:SAM-dependent methyltransferase
MKCRHCQAQLKHTFIDLGTAPPSNSYLNETMLSESEKWYPLRVLVCDQCWLVQTQDFVEHDDMFNSEYAYFSSYSTSWLTHANRYTNNICGRFKLDNNSFVIEIASNDGYLLQYFKERNIPCLGIEPTKSTAMSAREKGIEVDEDFFSVEKAESLLKTNQSADLLIANNVLAHVPNINDFVVGFSILLKPTGIATFEFPHLLNLIKFNQFDTIYHEHFSYLSLIAVKQIFNKNGLTIFDVEKLSTHGGSLRVYASRSDTNKHNIKPSVEEFIQEEVNEGITNIQFYTGFQKQAQQVKFNLLGFLLEAKKNNKTVMAYGAAAKGNTILNFSGIRADLLTCIIDRSPAKQNKYTPGSRIPIMPESFLKKGKPDYVIILPWNLKDEIESQLNYIEEWNGKFVHIFNLTAR